MIKVITYGTFDVLHHGHIRLLERAKALGDYLIVGVTSDDYDKTRGKINNQQGLIERVMAVKALGIADEVIAEEYDGQKIDDIKKYHVDIFTVGSDWEGKFDYLNEYCKVVYLSRTAGISSTEIRTDLNKVKIGLMGDADTELTSVEKFLQEVAYVNGTEIIKGNGKNGAVDTEDDYAHILKQADAVYIVSHPTKHYEHVSVALKNKVHVLCESPLSLSGKQTQELLELADKNGCILMESAKTAYTTAFERLVLLAKSGQIGSVVSVDATCTSVKKLSDYSQEKLQKNWNTITEWGPLALLAVFQILGTDYRSKSIYTRFLNKKLLFDDFTKVDFVYDSAVASIKIAKGAKSEGELIVTGTKGYIYVPAPWWKTDYFEIRYENPLNNKRYFYQLDGEGIRYEIVELIKMIENKKKTPIIDKTISIGISKIMEAYYRGDVTELI
ncbi:MAG: adenylyltransferase/cytidyltransferase family protein [Ruminococcus sp.]|nr:adenylyltransferase/cytidyltransferase family protein [Ruminococcus sp.]